MTRKQVHVKKGGKVPTAKLKQAFRSKSATTQQRSSPAEIDKQADK